jgi:hypothetical protein
MTELLSGKIARRGSEVPLRRPAARGHSTAAAGSQALVDISLMPTGFIENTMKKQIIRGCGPCSIAGRRFPA